MPFLCPEPKAPGAEPRVPGTWPMLRAEGSGPRAQSLGPGDQVRGPSANGPGPCVPPFPGTTVEPFTCWLTRDARLRARSCQQLRGASKDLQRRSSAPFLSEARGIQSLRGAPDFESDMQGRKGSRGSGRSPNHGGGCEQRAPSRDKERRGAEEKEDKAGRGAGGREGGREEGVEEGRGRE